MKYLENMSMCCKNDDIYSMDTPAEITITCGYELQGFCIYSGDNNDCDFQQTLSQKDADLLNK